MARVSARKLDQRGPRTDLCPGCGGERQELPPHVVRNRFYCGRCRVASVGPNTTPPPPPPPEQMGLVGSFVEGTSDFAPSIEAERPPLDDADVWIPEDMPDE